MGKGKLPSNIWNSAEKRLKPKLPKGIYRGTEKQKIRPTELLYKNLEKKKLGANLGTGLDVRIGEVKRGRNFWGV